MIEAHRQPGALHGRPRLQREAGGFLVTYGRYSPSLRIDRHDHELASLCIVMEGGYDETFGRSSRRAEPGTLIVHPEGEHHADAHDPVPVVLMTIEVGAARLQSLRHATRALDEPWHAVNGGFLTLAARLMREAESGDPVSMLALEGMVLELLAQVDRAHVPEISRTAWLTRVRDYLDSQAGEGPSMDRLADLAGVHPVHLARAFRRAFGCSIGAYARRLQVERAMALLAAGELSLAEVAATTGFSDQSHMTRLVRAQTGATPGAWRRRLS